MPHALKSWLPLARESLSRFRRDRRGNVAPIFAIAMLPIVALTGTAIDYSRANAARTEMQAALDATALTMSKEAVGLTQEQLNTKATNYFTASFANLDAKNMTVVPVLVTPQAGSFTLTVTASGSVDLRFMGVFGQSSLPISSSAEVKWGIKKLELAMVLDNTGSMAQSGKMTALKTASHNLLTTLKNAAKKLGDVKVAIIPFDVTVKPGTGYKNEFWIDFAQNGIGKNSWEGCVQDRDKTNGVNNNTKDTTPVEGDDHTWFPAVQCGSLATLMPLTDVFDPTGFTNLNDKIDAMTPAGNTNTTIGLVWGWHALTSNLPLTQGAAARDRPRQGHHHADRRRQHRGSLVDHAVGDRRAHADGVRQRQGRQHQGLYGARDQRQFEPAAGLRHHSDDVLRRAAGERTQQRVHVDRAEPGELADF